jgi:type VII secretion protein EccB
MLHDPMRSQSRAMLIGIVVAALLLAGCAILALLRPQDKIGDALIVVAVGERAAGTYVRIDDTLHPVLNLASARLIVGEAAVPAVVKESELGRFPRGALVGIPGAPSAMPIAPDEAAAPWTVCDTADVRAGATTTLLAGELSLQDRAEPLAERAAVLAVHEGQEYLLYRGARAKIDTSERAVARAFGLEGAIARPVSRGLLNSLREVPAMAAPSISKRGEEPEFRAAGLRIGDVASIEASNGERQYYVVLADGIQQIEEAVADLIRFADPRGRETIPAVSPGAINQMPTARRELAVRTFPHVKPELIAQAEQPVTCLSWTAAQDGAAGSAQILVGHALPLPESARATALAGADDEGDRLDAVYMKPGTGHFVHSGSADPDSSRQGALFYVADTGVRYGIADREAATVLGMPERSAAAPWPMLELLAPGPALSPSAALVAHDGVAPSADPGPVAAKTGR